MAKRIVGKTANHIFLFPGAVKYMKNMIGFKSIVAMAEHKPSQYYTEEQQNFDYWKNKLNYTPEILQKNYKNNAIISYIMFLCMILSLYSIVFSENYIIGTCIGAVFFARWHRCLFLAKCIKDFTMYKNFGCIFKKADDVFPNPFEPIKEKFSLIYDQGGKSFKDIQKKVAFKK